MKTPATTALLFTVALGFSQDVTTVNPESEAPESRRALPVESELRPAAPPYSNQPAIDDAEAMLDSAVALEDDNLILQLCDKLLALTPDHPDALRESTTVYLHRKDAVHARAAAERYVQARPDDALSHLCYADACSLPRPGESHEKAASLAAQHLAMAKKLSGNTWDLQREQEYADNLEASGNLRGARLSYLSLARLSTTSPYDRATLLEHADDLASQGCPHLQVTVGELIESEGNLLGVDLEAVPSCGPRWSWGMKAHVDWLTSYTGPKVAGNDSRTEVLLTSRIPLNSSWILGAQLGVLRGSETHVAAGVSLKRNLESGIAYGISANYNQRANDSLPLIYAGGREHKIAVEGEIPLSKSVTLEIGANVRELESDIGRVGWGYAQDVAIAWRVLKSQPSLTLRYEWEHANFNVDHGFASKADAAEYVLNEINTHLAVIHIKRTFGRFTPSIRISGGYRFAQHTPEYGFAFYTAYRLSDDMRITIGYEYDSAGSGTASSSNTHYFSLSFNALF
jgi:hypothetical protein